MQENLKKPLLYAAVLAGAVLVLIVVNEIYQYLYYKLPPTQVTITMRYAPGDPCRQDAPMHMRIVNDSYREIVNTAFTLSVKADEHSNNITQLSAGDYSTDTVVGAGDTYEGCWIYPKLYSNKHDPEKLLYEVIKQSIKFKS